MNPFETQLTVNAHDLPTVTRLLADRGCIVLDRGERIATDEGDDAEAVIHVLFLPDAHADATVATPAAAPA